MEVYDTYQSDVLETVNLYWQQNRQFSDKSFPGVPFWYKMNTFLSYYEITSTEVIHYRVEIFP